jgi:clan AA aspartic protease
VIHGTVNPFREAILILTVRGPSGQEAQIETVIDTGFSDFLALPPHLIAHLGLRFRSSTRVTLADGSTVALNLYRATVLWDGQPCDVPVIAAGSDPLVGMSLLYGFRVTIEVLDGGPVMIEALP